jgi:uncharacterized protein YdgA (DUF945 family)
MVELIDLGLVIVLLSVWGGLAFYTHIVEERRRQDRIQDMNMEMRRRRDRRLRKYNNNNNNTNTNTNTNTDSDDS